MHRLRALWARFRSIFACQLADKELAAELESHLQLHIDDNVRSGMSPEQARRDALIKLGGVPAEVAQFFRPGSGMGKLPVGDPGVHSKASAPVSASRQGLLLLA